MNVARFCVLLVFLMFKVCAVFKNWLDFHLNSFSLVKHEVDRKSGKSIRHGYSMGLRYDMCHICTNVATYLKAARIDGAVT